jgi:ABC-type sugar transport system substrate-binding protein
MSTGGRGRRAIVLRLKIVLVVTAAFAIGLPLAGCASNSGGTGTSAATKASASSGAQDAVVAQSRKVVAESTDLSGTSNNFPMPTQKFNPGHKSGIVISCGDTVPACATNAQVAVEALRDMGWEVPNAYDGQVSTTKWAGYVDQAVQDHDAGIILVAIDPALIASPVEAALKAGIAISCLMCAVPESWLNKGIMEATVDWTDQGEILGDWLIAERNGKAKVATFVDPAYPQTTERAAGLAESLSKCAECSLEVKQEPVADSAEPGPPAFTALMGTTPPGTLTDAVAYGDASGLVMANTLKSDGRTDILVSGYDAEPQGAQAMINGSPPYGASVGQPYTFAAWAAADLVGRKSAGVKLWNAAGLPSYIMTKADAAIYKTSYLQPEGDWQSRFKALWGSE